MPPHLHPWGSETNLHTSSPKAANGHTPPEWVQPEGQITQRATPKAFALQEPTPATALISLPPASLRSRGTLSGPVSGLSTLQGLFYLAHIGPSSKSMSIIPPPRSPCSLGPMAGLSFMTRWPLVSPHNQDQA